MVGGNQETDYSGTTDVEEKNASGRNKKHIPSVIRDDSRMYTRLTAFGRLRLGFIASAAAI